MARVEGFEPPTAWFVARYSIQLSYTRAVEMRLKRKTNCCYEIENAYAIFDVLQSWERILRTESQVVKNNLKL